MQETNIIRKFEIIASILVVLAMAGVTFYMIRAATAGHFTLWPYAVFAVFAAGVLCIYGAINKAAGKEYGSYCPADLIYSSSEKALRPN